MWFNTVRQNAVLADRLGNLKKDCPFIFFSGTLLFWWIKWLPVSFDGYSFFGLLNGGTLLKCKVRRRQSIYN